MAPRGVVGAVQVLREGVERLRVPRRHVLSPRHAIMTIRARDGFAVLGAGEGDVINSWRFANHHAPAFTGDLVLMTPNGWVDWVTGFGGHEPRL